MRGRKTVVHRRWLALSRVSASATSLHDRDEHDAKVPSLLLSEKFKISPANVTTTEEKGDGTKGSTLRTRKEDCDLLSMSLEPDLREIREDSASLAAAGNGYKVRMKN